MGNMQTWVVLVTSIWAVGAYAQEHDIGTIITIMDAYEQQIDSVKLTYSYATGRYPDGTRELTKGVFAQKVSDGYVLLDEKRQRATGWDETKEPTGILRAFDGELTRYFEHETNKHGYHTGDIRRQHNPAFYKTGHNPYYRIWGVNYKTRFTDLLRDPNAMPTVERGETIDGCRTLKVSFESYKGAYHNHLWLVPEKNYLPIKLYTSRVPDGHRICEMHWGGYTQCGEDIWYPMDIQLYVRDSNEPTTIRTDTIELAPLTQKDFQFAFPPYTHVTDHIAGVSYVTTPTDEETHRELVAPTDSLTNADKEKLLNQYIEGGNVDITADSHSAKAGHTIAETAGPLPHWTVLLVLGIVAMGCLILVLRRKSHV